MSKIQSLISPANGFPVEDTGKHLSLRLWRHCWIDGASCVPMRSFLCPIYVGFLPVTYMWCHTAFTFTVKYAIGLFYLYSQWKSNFQNVSFYLPICIPHTPSLPLLFLQCLSTLFRYVPDLLLELSSLKLANNFMQ